MTTSNEQATIAEIKKMPHEQLLGHLDEAIHQEDEWVLDLNKRDRAREEARSIYLGKVSVTHLAQIVVVGRSEHNCWLDYLIENGFAKDRDTWNDWHRGLPWSKHEEIRKGYDYPAFYFAVPALRGALVRMRNRTGYVERDDIGWWLTDEGQQKLHEYEALLAENELFAEDLAEDLSEE